MNDDALTIDRFLRIVRQRWKLVALAFVVCAGAAYMLSRAQADQYEAQASLLFRDSNFDQTLFGSSFLPRSVDPDRAAQTNVRLVSLDVVAEEARRRLGSGYTARQLSRKITVASEGRADVVTVTARDGSPAIAARLANAWAEAFITSRRLADRAKIAEAQRLVTKEIANLPADADTESSSRRRSLVDRRQQLEILASLQTGNAELAQPAQVPRGPASPRPKRNGILGGIVGLIIGILAAVVLHRLDRRLSTPEEASEVFGRPLLGVVPASAGLAAGDSTSLAPVEADAFRMLRTNLRYFNVDHDVSSVVVTSAAVADGKSTIAVHLAEAAARAGTSTLLLECDLRRPSLRQKLHRPAGPGLTDFLAGTASSADVIESIPLPDSGAALDVAFAGPIPPNPADLLESDRMGEFLREAEAHYDLVVIDTPPSTVVSDAIPLLKRASGVIVAVRLRKTTRDESEALRVRLENLDAHVLGVVVNDVRNDGQGYYYYQAPYEAQQPA